MAMFNNYGYGAYNPQQNYQGMLQQPQMQINTGSSLISVRTEAEARNYPIAPGNSLTFKDEAQPYVYVKTMGPSTFDQPSFEKFRLVREDTEMPDHRPEFVLKSEFDALKAQVQSFLDSGKEGDEE